MTARDHTVAVLGELERTLGAISPDAAEKLVDRIVGSKKILVAGAGRSGLAVRGFAMRLMHMGFDAYVVGETVTPHFETTDLLLIGSGSGETGSLVQMAKKAREIGGNIAIQVVGKDQVAVGIMHARTVGGDHVRFDLKIIADLPHVHVVAAGGEHKVHATGSQEF